MMEKINILIIEDETYISIIIERLLDKLGHNTIACVEELDEAINVIQNNNVDLIIADIRLRGDIDGIDIIKKIYENYKIPVIFLTGYKNREILERIKDLSLVGFLIKPYRDEELENYINLAIIKYNLPVESYIVKLSSGYSFCKKNNILYQNDKELKLTKYEKRFIKILIEYFGDIVPYSTLESIIWEYESISDGTRRQFFYRFRQKFTNFPVELIKGVGCRLKLS